LLKTSACSEKLKTALNQLPPEYKQEKILQLAQMLGRVPRVLVELSDFLERHQSNPNTFKDIGKISL
jgi:uncharacterized membrane protein YccC